MKRTKAVATLLLCHPLHTTPFAPNPHTKRTARVHHHNHDDDDDERWHLHDDTILPQQDASSSSYTTRRSFLAAATLLPLALITTTSSCSAAAASTDKNTEPLSQLHLGQGQWINPHDSSSSTSTTTARSMETSIVPATFATYLARFLIRYDDDVSSWWKNLVGTYSLLTSREMRRREGRVFATFAESIRRGVHSFVCRNDGGRQTIMMEGGGVMMVVERERYALLLDMLLEKYGEREGAVRHIGLLFAMLPPNYQPVEALRVRLENVTVVDAPKNAALVESSRLQKNSLPPNFTDDVSSLLPKRYCSGYNTTTKSFQITPALQLYEIGINEESGTTAISTIFGPLSSQPLTRTRPNLGKEYYTLLGISGGVGCAVTHALVIPLDVVK
eukprot:CCRYP_004372-RA/>CCRYP_004372-RA protein AED:0.08 eAED:0.08 QI:109/1/1/1/0/0.5/2/1303/387